MPNNITNILSFTGNLDIIASMLNEIAYSNEEDIPIGVKSIDFTKILPPPSNIFQGAVGPKERELYGKNNWYDWNRANWGTKWNSYGYSFQYPENESLIFETAWSAPHPVIKKLSEMYPNIAIEHQWADEDIGYNCGERKYLGGNVIHEFMPDGKEAFEFACAVKGLELKELGLVLNATETDYINEEDDEYEVVSVFGNPGLFSSEKLTLEDIPKGLFLAYLKESDDKSEYSSIEQVVGDNFAGSLITTEPLEFGASNSIQLTEPGSVQFIDGQLTFGEFVRGEFDSAFSEDEGMTL